MKQVVLNLGQSQFTTPSQPAVPGSRASANKLLSVKSQSVAGRPSVTFEQAERDENIYKPQPTEFVSFVTKPFCSS